MSRHVPIVACIDAPFHPELLPTTYLGPSAAPTEAPHILGTWLWKVALKLLEKPGRGTISTWKIDVPSGNLT
jgi:hypothetical protein